MAYILINKKPLSSIATNDILVIAILTFLSSFIIFPSVEISTIERVVIFFLISILSFLVLKHSNELAEQKINYEKKIEEGTKAIEAKNAELTEIKNRLENTSSDVCSSYIIIKKSIRKNKRIARAKRHSRKIS
jgi:large-conductance mechanosensitive channel